MRDRQSGRVLWTGTWAYKESILLASGLLLMGTLLSYVLELKVEALAWPFNLISAIILIALILLCRLFFYRSSFFKWLSGKPNAIVSIALYLFLVLLLGLIPQKSNFHDSLLFRLGYAHLLSSHQFLLAQIYLLFSLGMTIAMRWRLGSWRDASFIVNHIGLWIVLMGIGLGAGDIMTVKMEVNVGQTAFRAVSNDGRVYDDLGIAVELLDFEIECYTPKAFVINAQTGDMLYDKQCVVTDSGAYTSIGDWDIEVDSTLPLAVKVGEGYHAFYNSGASPAAHIQAVNTKTNAVISGWISCGSYLYPPTCLDLDSTHLLVMVEPEAKTYRSLVKVYTQSGKIFEQTLMVGHPISVDGWKIYQTSYDSEKGLWSEKSIIELVRDPWIKVVYCGFFMLIAGAIMLLFNGKGGTHAL